MSEVRVRSQVAILADRVAKGLQPIDALQLIQREVTMATGAQRGDPVAFRALFIHMAALAIHAAERIELDQTRQE